MSDLEPRRSGGISRRQREQRAYTLVLATGGLALAHDRARDPGRARRHEPRPAAVITALLARRRRLLLKRTLSP